MELITVPEALPKDQHPNAEFFLAGSIDQGKATNWQQEVSRGLETSNCRIFSPRRRNWDDTWPQVDGEEPFTSQVEWELEAAARSNLRLMHLEPGMQSPISLLEFGLFAGNGRLIVHCPEGFWRKGNVDVTARIYGVTLVDTLQDLIKYAMEYTHA